MKSTRIKPSSGEPQVQLQFDDNSLLPLLFGEHDQYLARIEQQLEITLVSRGNRIAISGPPGAAEVARAALEFLYDRLERGRIVDQGEVDGAIRRASANDGTGKGAGGASKGADAGEVVIRTRKRLIAARTPVQATYIEAMGAYELVFGLGPAG
ncbi:MAG: phosphate starvation-inducible protein PhoH, partial [Alphaproteobacteria bacterium]|nr:phosphate starvation-inducible protein PhoH [Alphaproteobacteria bacterium]